MEDYILQHSGQKPIRKILIANNGMAAVKFIRSIQRWTLECFNDKYAVEMIGMATPEDRRANTEYIRLADRVINVPGGSNVNNYANVNLIVKLACEYHVDAVWAGWGHASENPQLPNRLLCHGITFIGPPGAPMFALGDKIGSTLIAQSVGVPTIAWNGDGLQVSYKETKEISADTYDRASIHSVQEAKDASFRLGFPVMIKASEGGGGKGIRRVDRIEDVETAYRQVVGEMPKSPIFIMRVSEASRHLEVQLMADQYGQAIAISGRDCSIQRRHQKIIEEGPPSAARRDIWRQMELAAIALAKEVGYINLGTVEFLYNDKDEYFFLELNPRLQVEHPVTEMITGMNLPACQLQISMGIPLHKIPDVQRFYKMDVDFDKPGHTQGHCIAARITAEDPYNGFKPTSGKISEITLRTTRNVWGYFSIDSSGCVHEFADSQIGHVFSWGATREEARVGLAMALSDLTVRGEICTTTSYILGILDEESYRQNQFNTTWLDKRLKQALDPPIKLDIAALAGAACMAHVRDSDTVRFVFRSFQFHFKVTRIGKNEYLVEQNKSYTIVDICELSDGGYLVGFDGCDHHVFPGTVYMIDNCPCPFKDKIDPSRLVADAGGTLIRYLVCDGEYVEKGVPYAEMEVMKMIMHLITSESGTFYRRKPEGSRLTPGDLIAQMTMSNVVPEPIVYSGKLAHTIPPIRDAFQCISNALLGYKINESMWTRALQMITHEDLDRAITNGTVFPRELSLACAAKMTTPDILFTRSQDVLIWYERSQRIWDDKLEMYRIKGTTIRFVTNDTRKVIVYAEPPDFERVRHAFLDFTSRTLHVTSPRNVAVDDMLCVFSEVICQGRRFVNPTGCLVEEESIQNASIDVKRSIARDAGTCYCYDIPSLFKAALNDPNLEIQELVLSEYGIVRVNREPGLNDIGMVAWEMKIKGKWIVLLANDITFSAGTFGTLEDLLFNRASFMARAMNTPRLYFTANSGARIGLAEEIKQTFQVCWIDEAEPSKGFHYLFLPNESDSVLGEYMDGRFKIHTIIGKEPDLGVENLKGSGMIAGETSRAYNEIFTISFVSGRSVGIGAYLVRLGRRVIQKRENAPLLLTGYQALNTLMNRNVYTSNMQLGGPDIMYANGTSHILVDNDLEGVKAMIRWLSFAQDRVNTPLDSSLRKVQIQPDMVIDPRELLTGATIQNTWCDGLFDRDSFMETMGGWARSVITGRARLGGISVGVIIPETRQTETYTPVDPAFSGDKSKVTVRAGQVWYPDSAFKTAQTIEDVNHEGLPLIILANWRGFSGGSRDMHEQVLKFGAMIVDALVAFKQPVYVYILPGAELRGGAWVVLDSSINPKMMKMYADPSARGNVLEPSGCVSVKFRDKEISNTIHRLDEKIKTLAMDDAKKKREEELLPVYRQIALHFVDLHDTPDRMEAKKTIHGQVKWSDSRMLFVRELTKDVEKLTESHILSAY